MKQEIIIPSGCKRIVIEMDGGKMLVNYFSDFSPREIMCAETGEKEELPMMGDFSIFWNNGYRHQAIVANLKQYSGRDYMANNGDLFHNAIKFRNYEQFMALRGIYE